MKKDIHPDYHEINVVMTDGSKFKTFSTYGKEGDTLQLDVDSKSHQAWVGGDAALNQREGKVAKFSQRFGSIGQKKTSAAAPKAEEKTE